MSLCPHTLASAQAQGDTWTQRPERTVSANELPGTTCSSVQNPVRTISRAMSALGSALPSAVCLVELSPGIEVGSAQAKSLETLRSRAGM